MFTNNPFAELSASISPAIMKTYIIVMVVLVVAGTLFDIIHKRSARYFFDNWRQAKHRGSRQVGGGAGVLGGPDPLRGSADVRGVLHRTAKNRPPPDDVRFPRLRHHHRGHGVRLPDPCHSAPAILPSLWHIGALMVCVGGYWFWFFIRADVSAEGNSPFRVMHADLFILSLLASVTLGLVWSFLQGTGASWWTNVFFALYVATTTVLFASVPWSKFAHMFFKPAAAFQKRVADADGSRSKLPPPADKPEVFGSARRLPQNY